MVRVVFVHPDLGIGGAERLVVDAALALQRKGHSVRFLTPHHDPSHAFKETTDGQLSVKCVGDWLPRSTYGRLAAFWAYVRMVYVSIYLVYFSGIDYDVAFVDQVSACVPFLQLKKNTKVLFYCHFPDQLLTGRNSVGKKCYRYILDSFEEWTTKLADKVLVNSEFTAGVYKNTFKSIKHAPLVLYPSLDFRKFDETSSLTLKDIAVNAETSYVFLSLNRYERKKNVGLAILALENLILSVNESTKEDIHLIIAGGYDKRVEENICYYDELVKLVQYKNLEKYVTFLRSPIDEVKLALLQLATCLIYTPENEHFGIVPIEAMYCKTPVIAVNSGGPKETVVMNETGFLCKSQPEDFCNAMKSFVNKISSKTFMGEFCKRRVVENFSYDAFSDKLSDIIECLVEDTKIR